MKNKTNTILIISFVLVIGLSCGFFSKLRVPEYFEGDTAQVAADANKEKIGKPFRVTEVFIDRDSFDVKAQDPDKPNELNEYKYIAGFVSGPNPVKVDGLHDDLQASSFPFEEIDFSAIPKMAKDAIEKSKLENAGIYRMEFGRGFSMEGGFGMTGSARWTISVTNERDSVKVYAQPNGEVIYADFTGSQVERDFNALTKTELQKAQLTYNSQFEKDTKVADIHISELRVRYHIPIKENPKKFYEYVYDVNGLFKKPSLSKTLLPHEQLFNADEIVLTDALRYIEKAQKRLELPDARVSFVSIDQKKPNTFDENPKVAWSVYLKSGVNEGYIQFDNKTGKEIYARKNGEELK